jgi:hypothetical protein
VFRAARDVFREQVDELRAAQRPAQISA